MVYVRPHPPIIVPIWIWIIYHIIIFTLIIIDLMIAQRKPHEPSIKEATAWVTLWIGIAAIFGIIILYNFGPIPSLLYYTAYVIEYSLSMDNLFVFLAIFSYFAVPFKYQHKTLYIGIISAIFFRATFILAGLKLLETFSWMVYVFGIVLIYSGIRLGRGLEKSVEPSRNPIVKAARKVLPITDKYIGAKFIVRNNRSLMFTPLVIVLLAIETTDVIFAFDSVPAVIAITEDFFLAYTSNISAILGLRSLYFLLAAFMLRLKYLSKGLAFILTFLGIKLIIKEFGIDIPILLSIGIIFSVILGSAILSVIRKD